MKAYLYVLNTLADWEIAYITAELNSGRYLDKSKSPVSLVKIGNSLKPITTMGGIDITPDETIENIKFAEGDLLILPGADTWLEEENTKIMDIVSEIIDKGVTVAAICGATFALAKKGILDNRKHTSNDLGFLKMICPEYRGEDFYLNQAVVSDNNLITSSGLAPLDFSYEVFKKTSVMKPKTLEAWYQLFLTKEAKFFYSLMESLK